VKFMYGGPVGRDKYSREIVYIKKTIYVKGYDDRYLSIAYLKEIIVGGPVFGGAIETKEVSTGRLDYKVVGRGKQPGVYKYQLIGES